MFKKINWWKVLGAIITGLTLGLAKLETKIKEKADAWAKAQSKKN